jgi:hypothetical protein
MATAHGKLTVITINAKDISPFTKTSNIDETAKTHDVTGYGPTGDAEVYSGGLNSGKFTCGGVYDNTVLVGPRIVLKPLKGIITQIIRKVEGTGTGKPIDTFNAILEKYSESNPHDDMVTWSADFQISGPVVATVGP